MEKMQILIVDDDYPFTTNLANALVMAGHKSHIFNCCTHAYEASLRRKFDLAIINVKTAGDEESLLIRNLSRITTAPIIAISSNGDLETKIHHLNVGATDYVVKPVDFEELMARVALQLRKVARPSLKISKLIFDDLIIHLSKNCVERSGKIINLTKQEFEILIYLARRQGELVTREELFKNVWGQANLYRANLVNVAVHRLRQKIDGTFEKKFLNTIHGIGYVAEYRNQQ